MMFDALSNPTESVAEVLIVEDDPGVRVLLTRTLRENGFKATSVPAAQEMWRALQDGRFDLILLDLMLPGASGLDLCKAIRRTSTIPIIIVTARSDELDKVLGLELGADDYIAKPFSSKELLARMRAVLRRGAISAEPSRQPETVSFDGWIVELRRRALRSPEGAEVELSGAEYDLLISFIESIDVLVSRLRRKLADRGDANALIRTVRGVGYIFTAKVERG
jgi:two-component system OmpR family response regulator